ncbi:MAG: UDP-glucose 4-epimerase GalE [Bacteroidetes bacterium]|nr:UDP-glucose 4-epimerase GalE [Bacteroidota bacterium]
MKILVTGGAGYIGSHVVVELQQHGWETVIVDDLSNAFPDVVDRISRITGKTPDFELVDLKDPQATFDLFRKYNDFQAVIHFAAHKAVGESVENPLKYYRNNILSLVNTLEAMALLNVRHIVFSSSCTVYGQPDVLPVTEETPLKEPLSPYGHTKRIGEAIINDQCQASNLQAIHLRYFNPIGAHESALIGELPTGIPDNLMPYITQTAIGKRDFLRIWGTDYNTPDGTAIRDYIHVVDLAKAHVKSLERLVNQQNSEPVEVFNLGTGTGCSVLEVVESFERTSGIKLKTQIMPRRPGDVEKVWADPTRANQILKWTAQRSLDDMTKSAWAFQKTMEVG